MPALIGAITISTYFSLVAQTKVDYTASYGKIFPLIYRRLKDGLELHLGLKRMSVPKILIAIVIIVALINLIGWFTKPDNYRPPQNYRGSLSPAQPYAQQMNDQEILAFATNRLKS